MSIFSSLDQAIGSAAQSVASDASNVIGDALSGVQLQVKTNLGPAFMLGGLYSSQDTQPGFLESLGIKYNVTALGSDGKPIATIGDPPPTEPVIVLIYGVAIAGAAYLMYRGVRSMVQS